MKKNKKPPAIALGRMGRELKRRNDGRNKIMYNISLNGIVTLNLPHIMNI
jgi:hypothetical protein